MRIRFLSGALVLLLSLGGTATAGADEELELPNLVPLAPFSLQNALTDDGSGPAVRFAFAPANRGEHPFDILMELSGEDLAPAHQCVRWTAPRVCAERREVGGVYWHEPHGHYHFDDYAQYELRKVGADGAPIFEEHGLVASSEKISFCLVDIERDDEYDGGPLYAAPFYLSCFARLGSMGVSPGWVDIYPPTREGQQLPLSGVPDGRYAIVAHLDPNERLYDADRSDNMSYTLIDVTNERAREVRR